MPLTFNKAPLVEIVAELRWNQSITVAPAKPGAVAGTQALIIGNSNKVEEFFMRFGGACYQAGFQQTERLVPSGFALIPGQAIYRYKKGDANASELLQVGAGIFSANAIPPYKSWTEFAPVVEQGIEALLKARDQSEQEIPFSSVSLRYIDAFGPELLAGREMSAFVTDVLGFSINLPSSVKALTPDGLTATSFIQIKLPVYKGLVVSISIGEGLVNNAPAVIMDTIVVANTEVAPTLKAAMDALNAARAVIHTMFMEMTKPLHTVMQPSGDKS